MYPPSERKLCFVTIGATASFDSLIRAVLTPTFLSALVAHNYTDLLLQYGSTGGAVLQERLPHTHRSTGSILSDEDITIDASASTSARTYANGALQIAGFDFSASGLRTFMRAAKGILDPPSSKRKSSSRRHHQQHVPGQAEGVVISHAGSGSILDALRVGVPTVVVPNPALLDNHQAELAEELSRLRYVVHGRLDEDGEGLARALDAVERVRGRLHPWLNAAEQRAGGEKVRAVMGAEMGFTEELGYRNLD